MLLSYSWALEIPEDLVEVQTPMGDSTENLVQEKYTRPVKQSRKSLFKNIAIGKKGGTQLCLKKKEGAVERIFKYRVS